MSDPAIHLGPKSGETVKILSREWYVVALVIAITVILCLSPLLWVKCEGLNPLVSHSEFFAYSWIYGIRWGGGEQVLLPHSQLLLPIFALINWAFGMSSGSTRQILDGWIQVSFYWPLFLMISSLVILYSSMDRKGLLLNVTFSSIVFVAAVPLFLGDPALFSTSYHSLAIPLALLSLLFWKHYTANPARHMTLCFFIMLGFYTALCGLGKPTFIAFAAPFFAMEALKALQTRNFVSVKNIVLAAGTAALTYFVGIIAFYHQGFEGISLHITISREFMTSQYHWYDAPKGKTPIHWYLGYVIGMMGWLPTTLLVVSMFFAFFSHHRTIVMAGVTTAFLSALSGLYFRSQLHAHPEFIAAAAAATIGAFRCSNIATIGQKIRAGSLQCVAPFAIAVAAIVALMMFYPVNLIDRAYMVQQSKLEGPIIVDTLFQKTDVRTLVVMNYPDRFPHIIDTWCRGGAPIFFITPRSNVIDRLFPNMACANNQQAAVTDLSTFNRIMFKQPVGINQKSAIMALVKAFPQISGRLQDCRKSTEDLFGGSSFFLECNIIKND